MTRWIAAAQRTATANASMSASGISVTESTVKPAAIAIASTAAVEPRRDRIRYIAPLATAPRPAARSLAQLEASSWYIGIDLKVATSIPRSSTIACTHFGVRPIPLQV